MQKNKQDITQKQIDELKDYFTSLQNNICLQLSQADGKKDFIADRWQREEGGGGISRVLEDGDVIEKGGVNFSHVYGNQLPQSASSNRQDISLAHFEAMGVSLVIHPHNPYVPTSHMNVRFFTTRNNGNNKWWFGGGYDLTPYYGNEEDCKAWHQKAKQACDPFGEAVYPEFKKWCDDYFYLPHRKEARGIGGIFFDDLNRWPFEKCFEFIKSVGNSYIEAYLPIIEKRKGIHFSETEKDFQRFRRGRYVEFNLVYDRGTIFGLQSKGRTESILMSLPPEVKWQYNWQAKKQSKEYDLYKNYLPPRDWLNS